MRIKPLIKHLTLAGLLAMGTHLNAGTVTKAGSGTDLNDGASWGGGTAPGSADIATWNSGSLGAGLTLGSDSSWLGISISGALTNVGITGAGTLTLGASGLSMPSSSVNLSLGNNVVLGASQSWGINAGKTLASSGSISGGGGLNLNTAPTTISYSSFLTNSPNTNLVFSSTTLANFTTAGGTMGGGYIGTPVATTTYFFSNDGTTATYQLQVFQSPFTKCVKVQLTQAGADIYGTVLYAKYISANVLGQNFDTLGGTSTQVIATSSTASGYGAATTTLTFGAIGTITLSGANTYSGGTTLNAGQLNLNNGGSSSANSAIGTGPLTLNGGTIDNTSAGEVTLLPNNAQNWNADFTYAGAVTNLNLGTGAVTLNSNRTLTVSAKKLTVGGSISGSGYSLTKSGGGTLALTGNNTYTGATTNAAGTLILTGANSYSGGTVISGGQVQVGAGGATGDVGTGSVTTLNIGSPAAPSLVFNRTDNPTFTNTLLTSGGTANNNYWGAAPSTRVNLSGPVLATNGFVWFCGPGTFNLANTAANNFASGVVLCSNAVVEFAAASAFNNVGIKLYINLAGGGTFRYTGPTNETLALNPSFGIAGTVNTFDVANPASALTLSSTLLNNGGASGITKVGPGTLILSALGSTCTGASVVSNGTLQVDGSIGTGTVSVNSGAKLTGLGTIGGAVTVQSNGLLTGVCSVSGATTIQNGGKLVPGTNGVVGTLFINNALSLAGQAQFRIDKTGGLPNSDLVSGMNGVTYGGTLRVTNITSDATALAVGDTFTLFTKSSGSYSGSFTNFVLPALGPGLSWDKSYLTVDGSIRVVNTVATPIFNPVGGAYATALSVSITADPGSTILYTTDGSDPTISGTRISGPSPITGVIIPLDTNVTLNAYATNAGFAASPVAQASYVTLSHPTWISPFGASWNDGINWSNNVVANGAAVPADFSTLTLFVDAAVTLDGSRTVGSLAYADAGGAYNWSLTPGTGGTLTLDNGTNAPVINVSNQTASIGVLLAGTNGFVKFGTGVLTLTANNTLAGGVTVNAGTLLLAQTNLNNFGSTNGVVGSGTLTINSGAVVQKAGHFQVSGINNSNNTSHVVINGGTFEFGGFQEYLRTIDLTGGTINGTNGADHIIIRAPADITINSFASATTSTVDGLGIGKVDLTFGNLLLNVADGAAATDLLITTAISENTGAGSGAKSLTKTGAGTLVLTGTNTYSGATLISNGVLRVDGSTAAGSAVTVVAGATLGGTGTVNGAVAVNGTVSPGASVGTLTTGAETWYDGSTLVYQVASADTNSAAGRDLLTINGTLDLERTNGGVFTIKLVSMADTNTPGHVPDFNASSNYTWTVGTATGLVNPGNLSYLVLDTSSFSNAHSGTFSLSFDLGLQAILVNYSASTAASTNANLSNLVVTPAGMLSPGFAANTLSYGETEAYPNSPITVTPTTADAGATIQVIYGGATNAVASGAPSGPLALDANPLVLNGVKVRVTAADASTVKEYVVTVTRQPSTTPPTLSRSVSGGILTLSWPLDHNGYTLQAQTNSRSIGLTGTWYPVAGSAATNQMSFPVSPAVPTVFYRLVYP
jgi:autotransporter-associated beta strand protein